MLLLIVSSLIEGAAKKQFTVMANFSGGGRSMPIYYSVSVIFDIFPKSCLIQLLIDAISHNM